MNFANHTKEANNNSNYRNVKPLFFQPRLAINQPNDEYEQEADAMADKVMRMPDTATSDNLFFKAALTPVQRKCSHCEEEEKQMQRKEINNNFITASAETENYINSLSGGRDLQEKERSFFEPRMGYDFSSVKVHTDSVAAKSAQSINALAYTTGNNIVFNEGQYAPDTDSGKRLLGHELTHVAQQAGAKPNHPGYQLHLKEQNFSGSIQLIQRVAFHESPSMENAEISEEENLAQRKTSIPSIQRMEQVNSSDPSRINAGNVHPWQNQPPVGDNINVNTDSGTAVRGWVAYGGPIADRYWCHGHTLGTFTESLYSVYSGSPMQGAVNDEFRSVSTASVQTGDIAVWTPNFDHSCIFQNVVHSGATLDQSQTTMSTKNGRNPLQALSLDQVNSIYGTASNQPAFFRHV